ncbi:MAG TPA: division/cell wall cluster transcriptional repressor MraZ [Anaerolineae bacterium]|nr:division/cell wall cluster transcriptional repressor MraZ [Anaerolineae bacterium]
MLLGEFRCAADSGGRLTIPAEFCAELGEGLVLTRGIERCLFVYPAEEWRRLAEKMRCRLPLTSRDARAFARLMFSGALACVPDQQGRIPLPSNLRQYAGIEDEAIVVGLYTHLEVWSPQRWQEVRAEMVEEGTAAVERLSHLEV